MESADPPAATAPLPLSWTTEYLVVGGGVAGVCCVEELCRLQPGSSVTLVSASSTVRGVSNYVKLTDALEAFDVEDVALASLSAAHSNLRCIVATVTGLDLTAKRVVLSDGCTVAFRRLCVCTGAAPKRLAESPLVLSLRDFETLREFKSRLAGARRLLVVGNGGIALSLVHEVREVPIVWALKDAYIGNTFFDASASAFFIGEAGHRIMPVEGGPAALPALPPSTQGQHRSWHWKGVAAAVLPLPRPPVQLPGAHAGKMTKAEAGDLRIGGGQVAAAKASSGAPVAAVEGAVAPGDALPPREGRRQRRKRQRGIGADTQDTQEEAAAEPAALEDEPAAPAALDAAAGAWQQHRDDAAPDPAVVHPHKIFGGSLGPSWIAILGQGNRQGGPAAAEPVFLEAGVEVVALRSAGDAEWRLAEPARGSDAAALVRELPREWQLFCPSASSDDPERPDAAAAPTAEAWPLQVLLSNGHVHGCDFLVSATGTDPAPHAAWLPPSAFPRSVADGGIVVDYLMRAAGHTDVFVAGDAASIAWPAEAVLATPEGSLPLEDPRAERCLWHQMRLWNVARSTARYAARAMADGLDPLEADGSAGLAFELFAHVTRFLGFKVVLLGLFNGQGLGAAYEEAMQRVVVTAAAVGAQTSSGSNSERGDACVTVGRGRAAAPTVRAARCEAAGGAAGDAARQPPPPPVEVHVRVSPGLEYAKLVVLHGRIVGAMLVGETGLEEAVENLVLNRLDVSGLDLLHPDTDLEDFFD